MPGAESHIVAASIGQARRTTFKLLREFIEDGPNADDYRISESSFACHVRHKESNTRVSVLASSGKTSQGLVRCPWLFADEPGSWETTGGHLLHEAIQTAQGKPGYGPAGDLHRDAGAGHERVVARPRVRRVARVDARHGAPR